MCIFCGVIVVQSHVYIDNFSNIWLVNIRMASLSLAQGQIYRFQVRTYKIENIVF